MSAGVSVCGAVTLFDHILQVPRLSASSSTVFVPPVGGRAGEIRFGGCGANQAAAIASLGGRVELLGIVGGDFEDSGYADHLRRLGVETGRLTVVAGDASGHSYLIHDEQGATFLVVEEGVATRGEIEGLASPDPAETSALLVLNMPFDRLALQLAQSASSMGLKVLCSGQLATAEQPVRSELLELADYVCCNRAEALEIGLLDVDGARSKRYESLEGVWVTDGALGIRHVGANGAWHEVPSVPVQRVVDPTGAGDGVVAGIAAALSAGATPLEATQAGAVVASFVVEAPGCQESLPSWEVFGYRHEGAFGSPPRWLLRG